ncbi:inactive protein RESTRICTED TEV MOVEMENT [Trifolium repens]|jgi:hypothetical protein|nr:inactive protein RESTRICTED TEV MOVEMENT [Trifolium repens]
MHPIGFTRGDIGAKVEYDFGRVRVFGERSIGSNKMIRFNEKYQVPSHCDISNIKGKFDGKTVIITIPKIPGKIPEPEQEPIEENNNNVEEVNNQQNTSDQAPKSNVESKEDQTPQEAQKVTQEENSQKGKVTKVDSKVEAYNETQTSQETTQESIPQKGQKEMSQKESIPQKGQEEISQHESTPQKGQEEISQHESIPQKGQEEISQKSQVTKVESKGKAYHETSTQSEGTYESMPQKGEDQGTLNKATDTKDAKLQTEENTSRPKDENKEKKRVVREETKDHFKKTIEETKEESKGSVTEETFPLKKTFKEKGKEMINDKFGDDDDEKKSDKKGIHESTRTRIKDMALSTTQAVTNYAKKFSEEDKQKLIYTGATILVVALGVYASYKYRSSRRS